MRWRKVIYTICVFLLDTALSIKNKSCLLAQQGIRRQVAMGVRGWRGIVYVGEWEEGFGGGSNGAWNGTSSRGAIARSPSPLVPHVRLWNAYTRWQFVSVCNDTLLFCGIYAKLWTQYSISKQTIHSSPSTITWGYDSRIRL